MLKHKDDNKMTTCKKTRNRPSNSTVTNGSPCDLHLMPLKNDSVGLYKTRNSAIADKPRDAFRSQSRSPNMAPFHMLCIVSY